jgi:hypothetical protein
MKQINFRSLPTSNKYIRIFTKMFKVVSNYTHIFSKSDLDLLSLLTSDTLSPLCHTLLARMILRKRIFFTPSLLTSYCPSITSLISALDTLSSHHLLTPTKSVLLHPTLCPYFLNSLPLETLRHLSRSLSKLLNKYPLITPSFYSSADCTDLSSPYLLLQPFKGEAEEMAG